ncbi:uncharacterized protein [Apostichopus japonicus]|uniref:uncharacterized protein n=1 Tax=Stichopus japonicus TaxID=307972 RepID=UPI003AB5E1BB
MAESPEEKVPRHRVPLGNQWERWSEAKRNLHLKSDSEVARLLLDRFTRNFSKSAGRWTCVPVMEKNSYKYIPQLMKDIFRRRLHDDNSQLGRVVLAEDDPRHISGTIRQSQPPSVLQLLASHHSSLGPSSTVVMSQIY